MAWNTEIIKPKMEIEELLKSDKRLKYHKENETLLKVSVDAGTYDKGNDVTVNIWNSTHDSFESYCIAYGVTYDIANQIFEMMVTKLNMKYPEYCINEYL